MVFLGEPLLLFVEDSIENWWVLKLWLNFSVFDIYELFKVHYVFWTLENLFYYFLGDLWKGMLLPIFYVCGLLGLKDASDEKIGLISLRFFLSSKCCWRFVRNCSFIILICLNLIFLSFSLLRILFFLLR